MADNDPAMSETRLLSTADAIAEAHATTRRAKRAKAVRQSLATRKMMKGGR